MFGKLISFASGIFLLLTACNPECDNLTGIFFASHPLLTEQELLIQAVDPNILSGRNVFFNNLQAETRFEPGLGLIVTLPEGVTGENVEMRIEDPDCVDFQRFSLNVQDEDFFANNPNFIPPAPPDVIIPTPNPPIPPSINNAWISPNNTDYCIWFRVIPADPTDENPTSFIITPHLDSQNRRSREFSVSRIFNCNTSEGSDLYHDHPVFGMIDTRSNRIEFWIDRGSNGVEEFGGVFIRVDDTPYDDGRVPPCGPPWSTEKTYMMQVVSKQTGRQLIMYQQL